MANPETETPEESTRELLLGLKIQIGDLTAQVIALQAEVAKLRAQSPNYEIDLKAIKLIAKDDPQCVNPIVTNANKLNPLEPGHLKIIKANIGALSAIIGVSNLEAILASIATIESLSKLDDLIGITSDQRTTKNQCAFRINQVLVRLRINSY